MQALLLFFLAMVCLFILGYGVLDILTLAKFLPTKKERNPIVRGTYRHLGFGGIVFLKAFMVLVIIVVASLVYTQHPVLATMVMVICVAIGFYTPWATAQSRRDKV